MVGSVGMNEWMKTAPVWLTDLMNQATKWAGIEWRKATSDDGKFAVDGRRSYPFLRGAEAWGSKVDPGLAEPRQFGTFTVQPFEPQHVIAIDLDIEAALIPSSTPGHHHLVINAPISWSDYAELLRLLARIGVIEQGFCDASLERKETFLRLPWIRKYLETEDALAALNEWLDADDRPEEFQTAESLEEWLTQDDNARS